MITLSVGAACRDNGVCETLVAASRSYSALTGKNT